MRPPEALFAESLREGSAAGAVGMRRDGGGMPLLIALAALGAAAMNLVLSSLPHLEDVFGVDYHATQVLLTAFLAGAALAQIGVGPLADARDPRVILILALGAFAGGSAMASIAPSLAVVGVGRFLQGFGGAACLVVAEAIAARESFGASLARRIGFLNAGMAVAIMIAPLAGGAIGAAFGWRAIFVVSLIAAGILIAACVARLPAEAARPNADSPACLVTGMLRLLRSRRFVAATLAAGFVMANYFCLAAFGPYIAVSILGLDRVKYGLLFAALGIGYVVGSMAAGRLYKALGEQRVVIATLTLGIGAGLAGLLFADLGALGKDAFLAIGCLIALTTGLTLPAFTGLALNAEAGATGAAAGLFNFAIFGIGGIVTHLVGDRMDAAATMAMGALPAVTLIALLAYLAGGSRDARA
jgi:DHA1 family bicyclomycin/chloramphenicol resistance-like MFS transporter